VPETVRAAGFAELEPATLYALLKLRVDVFVVEQRCAYPDLDGRDTEPATRHLWLDRAGAPVAYLRMLAESDGTVRIGRVAVAPGARRAGLGGRLLAAALAEAGDRVCVLAAQAHLVGFYGRHGFTATGPEYLDDDIPHVPMRRADTPRDRR
jgi:ElaA protein